MIMEHMRDQKVVYENIKRNSEKIWRQSGQNIRVRLGYKCKKME